MSDQPPTIMSVKQLAAYLAMAPVTIYRLSTAGKLPGHKIGGQWRFHKAAVDHYVVTGQLHPRAREAMDRAVQEALTQLEDSAP